MGDQRDWVDGALCAQTDPELWFPSKGESNRPAKRLCRSCPSLDPCLQWTLDQDEALDGVWGGTTERERRALRRAAA